jgi:hypothetical protein
MFRRVAIDHDPAAPHPAPRRQYVVHLAGEAELETSDGNHCRIGPGDIVLVEDCHGKGHFTRRIGGEERMTLFIRVPDETANASAPATGLIGAWRLEAWETHEDGGAMGMPFGPDPVGLLVYDSGGHMSGGIMKASRRPFARPREHAVELAAGETRELAEAFNSFLAYGGRWSLGADGLIRHHVEYASIPGWAGRTLVREFELDGDRLTLRTLRREVAGREQRGVLRWSRAV